MFPNQRAALGVAMNMMEALPADTVFGIEVTDEDTMEDPSVFNIFAQSHADQMKLIRLLGFEQQKPADVGEHYKAYRVASLLVSFIEPDEEESR